MFMYMIVDLFKTLELHAFIFDALVTHAQDMCQELGLVGLEFGATR